MAYSHDSIVQDKMAQLANVTKSAQGFINTQILSSGARDMHDNLGETQYSEYITDFNLYDETSFGTFDAKSFDELTDDEKVMRNLIFAESYFCLYYLAIALKKLVKGAVNTTRDQAGGASIVAAKYDDIIANADNYREQAFQCLSSAGAIGGDEDNDIHVEGTFGAFVV
jgi:hypothetical protein